MSVSMLRTRCRHHRRHHCRRHRRSPTSEALICQKAHGKWRRPSQDLCTAEGYLHTTVSADRTKPIIPLRTANKKPQGSFGEGPAVGQAQDNVPQLGVWCGRACPEQPSTCSRRRQPASFRWLRAGTLAASRGAVRRYE
jgi:hypothetical protein